MRITKYDFMRGVFVIKPDAPQGEHIQRLGFYENRDEPNRVRHDTVDEGDVEFECGNCNMVVSPSDRFCRECGQRLREDNNGGN